MTIHKPVLLEEVMENMDLKKGDIVVDATLGGGSYSREILKKIGDTGTLIAIDCDEKAIEKFPKNKNVILVNENFSELESILKELKIEKVNAVVADLGYSSDQMESEERGMSFMKNGKLDMRLNQNGRITAEMVVNKYSEKELEKIFREYGEERFAGKIAKKIIEFRKDKNIENTVELAEIIKRAVPKRFQGKIHPATKTFQAIRIEVNRELESLEKFIPQAIGALQEKGKIAIVSFHSLEDRLVKNIFRENAGGCICPTNFPICQCGRKAKIRVITKKPITPSEKEVLENPRARSAKLRVCERV